MRQARDVEASDRRAMALKEPEMRSKAALLSNLEGYARSKPDSLAIFFPSLTGTETALSWQKLDEMTRRTGLYFREQGAKPEDLILILTESVREQVIAFLGSLAIGALPTILSYPSMKQKDEVFLRGFGPIVEGLRPQWVFSSPTFASLVREAAQGTDARLLGPAPMHAPALLDYRAAGEPLFLQLSSGTTGLRKGVAVTESMLVHQMQGYARALDLRPSDKIVSWLPLYHDMGLVAAFLFSIFHGLTSVHFSPFDWLQRPDLYVRAITRQRATLTFLPNFAFNYLATRLDAGKLQAEGVRLDSLRAVINCSEPVLPGSVRALQLALAPLGLREEALQASFALAENTFAATQTAPHQRLRVDRIKRRPFQRYHVCQPADPSDSDPLELASSGTPVPGTHVRIGGGKGEREVGEIELSGSCLFNGYRGLAFPRDVFTADGWYKTGDLGYIAEGELFVTGRAKDLIIYRGHNIYPSDIEETINLIPGCKPGRAVAFGVADATTGTEGVVALIEADSDVHVEELRQDIRRQVADKHNVVLSAVEIVPVGTLVKSTSGKLSRAKNREAFIERTTPPRQAAGSARHQASAYYRLSPELSVEVGDRIVTATTPDGNKLTMPKQTWTFLSAWATPRSLEFLQAGAKQTGIEALLAEALEHGVLVSASFSDDFAEGRFNAVTRNTCSRSLVVQFRGGAFDLVAGIPPREFMSATGLADHNLIMLRDSRGKFYVEGVSPDIASFESLMIWLRGFIHGMGNIQQIYCVGTSMGAYAALRAGKPLGATAVWAFGPAEPGHGPKLLDALSQGDGDVEYHIWYGAQNARDRDVAESLIALPGVHAHAVPTDSHWVASVLRERGELPRLLKPPPASSARGDGGTTASIAIGDVLQVIRRVVPPDMAHIDADTSLHGLLDSFLSTLLLAMLIDTFGAQLQLSAVSHEDLSSAASIVTMLRRTNAAAPLTPIRGSEADDYTPSDFPEAGLDQQGLDAVLGELLDEG
jgi:fatty-acyl-CoA synthase